MPEDMKIVRWREWEGPGLEHLVLRERAGEVLADSVVICSGQTPFAVRYRIECDANWRARSVSVDMIGSGQTLVLVSDGEGLYKIVAGTSRASGVRSKFPEIIHHVGSMEFQQYPTI